MTKRVALLFRAFLSTFVLAFVALPMQADAQSSRVVDVTSDTVVDRSDPIGLGKVTLSEAGGTTARVCFQFRNLTAKHVTQIRFHIALTDQNQNSRFQLNATRSANTYFASGRLMEPPDPTAPGFTDSNNDGTTSCWTAPVLIATNDGQNTFHLHVDVTSVRYDDGSSWSRGDAFPRAFAYDGTPTQGPTPAAPQLKAFNAAYLRSPELRAPVSVYAASVKSDLVGGAPKMVTCYSFKNLADRGATTIQLRFTYLDANQNVVPIGGGSYLTFSETGTFTPPIAIENHCMNFSLPNDGVVGRVAFFRVTPGLVQFADGTTWTPGLQYTKRYALDGSAYSGAQPSPTDLADGVTPSPPGPNPNATPFPAPVVANGGGFVDFAGGQPFGEVAWVKGSTTLIGTATNKSSALEAGAAALAACYDQVAKAHDGHRNSDCVTMVNGAGLSSASTRCVALIFDASTGAYQIGYGPDSGAAYLDAGNKIRGLGASLRNTVVLTPDNLCNVR